jgi:hypothetical protein
MLFAVAVRCTISDVFWRDAVLILNLELGGPEEFEPPLTYPIAFVRHQVDCLAYARARRRNASSGGELTQDETKFLTPE